MGVESAFTREKYFSAASRRPFETNDPRGVKTCAFRRDEKLNFRRRNFPARRIRSTEVERARVIARRVLNLAARVFREARGKRVRGF